MHPSSSSTLYFSKQISPEDSERLYKTLYIYIYIYITIFEPWSDSSKVFLLYAVCYLIHKVFCMHWINSNIRYWEDIDFIYLSLVLERKKQKSESSSGGTDPASCGRPRLLSNRFYAVQCNGRKHSDDVNTEHTMELRGSGSVGHEIKKILHRMHRHVLPSSIYKNLEDWWRCDKEEINCVKYRQDSVECCRYSTAIFITILEI
jgi:hypothetical protein